MASKIKRYEESEEDMMICDMPPISQFIHQDVYKHWKYNQCYSYYSSDYVLKETFHGLNKEDYDSEDYGINKQKHRFRN